MYIIKQIYNSDRRFHIFKLKNININQTYHNAKYHEIIATTFATISVLIVIIFDTLCYTNSFNIITIGNSIAYCVPLVTTNYMVLQFCTYSMLLKQRFKWLNLQLKTIKQLCARHKYQTVQFVHQKNILSEIPKDA